MPREMTTRIDAIDGLRGLSVLFVILLHLNIVMPVAHYLPKQLSKFLFFSGYYGVILFFVISGFLITSASLHHWSQLNRIKPLQFYRLRAARILPCLLLLLIVLSMLHLSGVEKLTLNTEKVSLGRALLATLTFHFNVLQAQVGYLPGPWDVLWSLSVEEVFYLFFPLICLLAGNERRLACVLLLLIILGPFARVSVDSNEIWQDHGYLSCMDGIALGALAALLAHRYRPSARVIQAIFYSGLALTLLIFVFRTTVYRMGLTNIGLNVSLLEFGSALMLMTFHWHRFQISNSGLRLLLNMGRSSYEIYLTHMLVVISIAFVSHIFPQTPLWTILWYFTALIGSIILGQLMARYFSIPLNRRFRGLSTQ